MGMAIIADFMKEDIVTATPDEKVDKVARRMANASIGAVVLVKDGELAGMFTERDLLTRVVGSGLDPKETEVGDVATRSVVSVQRDTRLKQCATLLREKRVRHLPVVAGMKPVGIVSARDFFEHIAGGLEYYIDQMRYEEALAKQQDPYDHIGGSYDR